MPRRTDFPPRSRAAFTLIELLIGLAIATMIMGAAAVVFVTAMDSWERGSREQRLGQAGQTAADLVERYLRCAVPPSRSFGEFIGEDLSLEEVTGHRLTLLSSAGGRFPRDAGRTDVCEVTFALDPESDEGFTMRLDVTPDNAAESGGLRMRLSPYIRGFAVRYYEGEWLDEWYDRQLPMAVEFDLLVGDPADANADPETGEVPTRKITRLVWLPLGRQVAPEPEDALEGLGSESDQSDQRGETANGDGGSGRSGSESFIGGGRSGGSGSSNRSGGDDGGGRSGGRSRRGGDTEERTTRR